MADKPQEWYEERRKGIGGSDVAAALGVSPWTTQLELWGEKTGLVPSNFEGNEYTYWGEQIEELLMVRYEEEHTDQRILGDSASAHRDHECLRANVDGLIYDKSDGDNCLGIWEAKTASTEWETPPVNYQLQVQHYMHVYDLPYAIISVLFHGNKYQEFRIERDPKYATDLVPKLLKFWQNVEDKLPFFEATSMNDLNIKFTAGDKPANVQEVPEDSWYGKKIAYVQAQAVLALGHKSNADKAKIELTEKMSQQGDRQIKVNGKAVATLITVDDSKTFDAVKLRAEQPDLFTRYKTKTRRGYTSLRVAK